MSIGTTMMIAWLFSFLVWCVWPAHYHLRLNGRAGFQRAHLLITMLGTQIAIEAKRRAQPPSATVPAPERADLEIGVEIRIVGRLRIARRLPRWQVAMDGATLLVFLWEEWVVKMPRGFRAEWNRNEEPARVGGIWRRFTLVVALGRQSMQVVSRFVTVTSAEARVVLGTGDAALTAYLVGLTWLGWGMGLSGVRQRLRWHTSPRLDVRPAYDRRCLDVDARASATVRQGWLALAGVLTALHYARRRLRESWKSLAESRERRDLRQRAPSSAQPRA